MTHYQQLLTIPIIRKRNNDTSQLVFPQKIVLSLLRIQTEEKILASLAPDQRPAKRGKDMKDKKTKKESDELRPEYNFDYTRAVRGKYYKRLLEEGSNVVILDSDVAKAFHDSASVNEALRSLLEITRCTKRLTRRSSGSPENRASR